jgi:hypothetical protein
MHNIVIPMRARLYLLALIGQDSGGLEDEKRMTSTDLLYKLELSPGEASLYETPVPQGGAYLHLDRIAQAAPLSVDLSGPELRRAQSLLMDWKGYRPGDDRFIRPLLKDIRTALESEEPGGQADALLRVTNGAPVPRQKAAR